MAQPSLERFDKRAFLLKKEATEGIDAAPVAGTDAFQILDGTSSIDVTTKERNVDRSFLGAKPFKVATSTGKVSGGVEIVCPAAPGTDSAAIATLLKIAGMAEVLSAPNKTTRYNPISINVDTATGHWYHAGTLRKVLAARADISGLSMTIGDFFRAQTTIQGNCDEVDEASLPSGLDYSAFTEPTICTHDNSTLKIGLVGADPTSPDAPSLVTWSKNLSIDFGNNLATKEFTSHQETSVGRDGKFTLQLARTAKADFDPFAIRKAGSLIIAEWALDLGSNLIAKLGFMGQIEGISEDNVDDDYLNTLTGRCLPSDNGNDEFWVEFEDTTI